MSDHMKTQTTITRHDAEHLADEAARVCLATAPADPLAQSGVEAQIADSVEYVARNVARLADEFGGSEAWEKPLVAGLFDDLLRALGRALEQVDPAKSVA